MAPFCAYCAVNEGVTADHVPPKACFADPKPQLITVPACDACNHGFSKDDEEFRFMLSLRVGMATPATKGLHERNRRTVAKNNRLKRFLTERREKVWIRGADGFFELGYRIPWIGSGHDQMVRRLVRGLYCHVVGKPLPVGTPIHGTWSKSFEDPYIKSLWNTAHGQNIGDEGQFRYRFLITTDAPEASIWMMIFYDRHFVTGRTGDPATIVQKDPNRPSSQ